MIRHLHDSAGKMTYYRQLRLKMVHKMWSHDFRGFKAGLQYHTPEHFFKCFWQRDAEIQLWWLAYRFLLAAVYLVTWLLSYINFGRVVPPEDAHKYYIFLTNWSYFLNTAVFIIAFVLAATHYLRESNANSSGLMVLMPWYAKLYWVLHTICLPSSIGITAIFWVAVYNPKNNPMDVINISTHVFNSVSTFIDFLLCGHPYRILHVYWPLLYSIVYLFFTYIYYLCGGVGAKGEKAIYGILNWDEPGKAMVACVLGNLFLAFVHVVYWLLHKLKKAVAQHVEDKRSRKYREGEENLGMEHQPEVAAGKLDGLDVV